MVFYTLLHVESASLVTCIISKYTSLSVPLAQPLTEVKARPQVMRENCEEDVTVAQVQGLAKYSKLKLLGCTSASSFLAQTLIEEQPLTLR